MKSVVVYYSYSGNTKKVANILTGLLAQKGEAQQIELIGTEEQDSFFAQAKGAFFHKRSDIQPTNFDLSSFDLICLGTPVWAFAPAPAMNTYLDKCLGIEGKSVVLFTTYGSGAGKERCTAYMQNILSRKGAADFKKFSIQQFKVEDKEFVASQIKERLSLSTDQTQERRTV